MKCPTSVIVQFKCICTIRGMMSYQNRVRFGTEILIHTGLKHAHGLNEILIAVILCFTIA